MNDLNFFSIYQGSIKERKSENIYIYIAAAVLALIIVSVSAFYAVEFFTIKSSIDDYTNKLNTAEVQEKLKEAETINNKLSILGEYQNSLSGVIKSMKATDLIDDKLLIGMSGAIPSDISFSDWKMDGYEIKLEGITKSRSAVAELEHNLRILPEFKLVHVDKIKVGETVADNLTFEITCILKEVE